MKKEMKSSGFMLTADQVYSTAKPSLKDAVVLLGGGTGSFVSPQGLIITNHHVAFRAIQSLSTTKDDYLLTRAFVVPLTNLEKPAKKSFRVLAGIYDKPKRLFATFLILYNIH
jgi:hypothetical protein